MDLQLFSFSQVMASLVLPARVLPFSRSLLYHNRQLAGIVKSLAKPRQKPLGTGRERPVPNLKTGQQGLFLGAGGVFVTFR